jgi:hypothetical protein
VDAAGEFCLVNAFFPRFLRVIPVTITAPGCGR